MQQDKLMLMFMHGHHINYNKCALRSIFSCVAAHRTKRKCTCKYCIVSDGVIGRFVRKKRSVNKMKQPTLNRHCYVSFIMYRMRTYMQQQQQQHQNQFTVTFYCCCCCYAEGKNISYRYGYTLYMYIICKSFIVNEKINKRRVHIHKHAHKTAAAVVMMMMMIALAKLMKFHKYKLYLCYFVSMCVHRKLKCG